MKKWNGLFLLLLLAVPGNATKNMRTITLIYANDTPYRIRFNYTLYPRQSVNHSFFIPPGHAAKTVLHTRINVAQTLDWQLIVFPPKQRIDVNCGIFPHDPLFFDAPLDYTVHMGVTGTVSSGFECTSDKAI